MNRGNTLGSSEGLKESAAPCEEERRRKGRIACSSMLMCEVRGVRVLVQGVGEECFFYGCVCG